MPQHPKYANSPYHDLQRLYKLLDELARYGFIHEDIYQKIDVLMSELHPEATRSLAREESGSEIGDDDEILFAPSANALFHYVEPDDRPQYIQDLRNVISHWMYANSWSTEGVAESIRAARDIEYYRMHVVLIEDTDTLERYEGEEKTVWFPASSKPGRPGAYAITKNPYDPQHDGFAYWNGKTWFRPKTLLSDCLAQPRTKEHTASVNYCWRGFTQRQD